MPHSNDVYGEVVFVKMIYDAKVSDTNSPEVLAHGEFSAAVRFGILGQAFDTLNRSCQDFGR